MQKSLQTLRLTKGNKLYMVGMLGSSLVQLIEKAEFHTFFSRSLPARSKSNCCLPYILCIKLEAHMQGQLLSSIKSTRTDPQKTFHVRACAG